jgi:predicted tellurium resistance membrane protein TerC
MFIDPSFFINQATAYAQSCGESVISDIHTITAGGSVKLTAIETANNVDWLTMRNGVISRVAESDRLKVTVTEIIVGNMIRAGLTIAATPILELSASELLAGGYLTKLGIDHLKEMFEHEESCRRYFEGILGEDSDDAEEPEYQSGAAVRKLIMLMLAFCLENILAGKAITPNNLEILVGSLISNIGLVCFQVPAIRFFALNPGVSAGIVVYVAFIGATSAFNGTSGIAHFVANHIDKLSILASFPHVHLGEVAQFGIMGGLVLCGYLAQDKVFMNTIAYNRMKLAQANQVQDELEKMETTEPSKVSV